MKSLNEWMDSHGITPETAAEIFGKSVGTIRNWRSAGVPANQREWVEKRMVEWSGKPLPELPDRITLDVSREQFDEWSRAALHARQILREWAISTLDQAAEADQTGYSQAPNPLHSMPRAPEPGNDYRTRPAIDAMPGAFSQSDNDEGAA